MPQRTTAPVGAPCWIDLMSSDADRSRAFYGDLFGWTSEQGGEDVGGYINFSKDGAPTAGCMSNAHDLDRHDVWSVYLAVEEAKATADAAVESGGQVIVHPMEVLDLGTMGFLVDAGQAGIGIWQPGTFGGFPARAERAGSGGRGERAGSGGRAEPAGFPAWFELHTRDYDASVAFYRTVFGWDTRDE